MDRSDHPFNPAPRQGDRYVVSTEFDAIVQTHWFAPFTGGDYRSLPVGLEFIVEVDPPATASAVLARPEPPKRWETLLVEEHERSAEKYAGYSLVIPLRDLATHCVRR